MASLKSLTDDDLRKKLKLYGITSPVTASTRDILIKKLNHAIANRKKSSTADNRANNSQHRLHTFSSDEDEEEISFHFPVGRTSRLSRSKRDGVKSSVETPVSDRNGATNLNGSSSVNIGSSGGTSVRRVKFSSASASAEGRDRVGSLRSNDKSNVSVGVSSRSSTHSANSRSSVLSVNDGSYVEEPTPKRTKVSLGTYYPVCARSGISPRAKIHDDYDTGSDSDLAECEDAVDLSARAAAASGACDSRENSVLSNNNSFSARAFYQNHKSGISSSSDRLGLLKGDNVRSRKGTGRYSFLENGRRHEDEYSEDHNKSFSSAESVITQTSPPGNHEPVRVANGRHHSESNNSPIDPSSPGDESTWHYSIPLLLLVLLAVFFGVVAMLYVNMRIPLLPMLQSVPAMFCQAMANLPVPFLARTDLERQSQTGAPTLPTPHPQSSVEPPAEKSPPLSHTPENIFPICNSEVTAACLTRQEMAAFHQITGRLENVVMPAVHQQEGLYQCGQSTVRYMSVADLQTLLQDAQIVSENISSDSIVALGKLADLNHHWGLEAVRGEGEALLGISLISPPTHILCHVKAAIHSVFELIVFLVLAIGTCWLTFRCIKYHRHKKELEKQQVFEMVEQILEILGGLVGPSGKDYVAVNHVRDSIISPRDRKTKKGIWKEAVLFIDNYESRIRREIQSVGGEDCEIWRWTSGVPHSPGNTPGLDGTIGRPPAKMWQGQAFESLETTHNLPNVSPTSCLKIRNMFDCDVEFGDSWPSRIQDSILEKCEGISIVHVAVDRGSREGCVYLKCASLVEAGRAFRALHGWWYDGNLVTVKFLRDERYHQRFPSACHATRRLRPSNNKRLSLQVPAGQSDSVEHP